MYRQPPHRAKHFELQPNAMLLFCSMRPVADIAPRIMRLAVALFLSAALVVNSIAQVSAGLTTVPAQGDAPSAKYLVETDPRFTNGRDFLSSDHFLAQLALDPERTLVRYGDGFEEQRLLGDQVLTLTGRRRGDLGYANRH